MEMKRREEGERYLCLRALIKVQPDPITLTIALMIFGRYTAVSNCR